MAVQPYDHIDRQMRRADEIGDQALQAPEGEKLGLKALAPEMKMARHSWDAARDKVREATRVMTKEKEESDTAMAQVRGLYSEYQPMLSYKAGYEGKAAGEYATDDDFFAEVEQMEALLTDHAGEDWAAAPLAQLTAAVDTASKEFAESVVAGRELQKAQEARAQVADESRRTFVAFRRCVRGTYGSTSKEYRDLLDKQYRKRQGTPEPTPSPTA